MLFLESLGISLNLSTSVINRIENNKRKLDIHIIYVLATALNLEICQLLNALIDGKPIVLSNTYEYASNMLSHFESIIAEKNQIIEAKNWYIKLLEEKF